jgi:hypothetical protein
LLFLVTLATFFATGRAEITHILAISIDGLRGDFLQQLLREAPEEFPNFIRLRETSAYTYNARCDAESSVTVVNHIGMITGRPAIQVEDQPVDLHHGYLSNFPLENETIHTHGNPAVPYKASIFDVVHDRGLSTALT